MGFQAPMSAQQEKPARVGRRGPRFSETERERIKADVIRLDAARTFSQREIGGMLGIHESSVSLILKDAREAYRHRKAVDTVEERERALDELRMIKQEAFRAWKQSQGERQSVEAVSSGTRAPAAKGAGKPKAVEGEYRERVKIEPSQGDVAYLNAYMRAVEREHAILGIDAPKVTAVGIGVEDRDGGSIEMTTYNVVIVPDKDTLGDWQGKYTRQLKSGEYEVVEAEDIAPANAGPIDEPGSRQ